MNLDPAVPVYGASTPQNVLTQPAAPGETPVAVPDYRVSTPLVPSGPPAEAVAPGTTPSAAPAASNAGGFAYGTVPAAPAAGPSLSVAEAAAQYKANKAGMKSRVIDNQSLSTLDKNPSGLVTASELTMPQSDVSPDEAASLNHAKPEFAAAGDVLDKRDLAAVEAAVRRGQMQSDTASTPAPPSETSASTQRDEQTARPAEAQPPSAATERSEPGSEAPTQSRDKLPESSSALPILGIMGLLTIAGGALSVWRSRA